MRALCIGPALELASPAVGAVHSVFAHAVNLEVHGDLWTLVAAGRDDLPFGIRLATQGFGEFGLQRGDRVVVQGGRLRIAAAGADWEVDCRAAARWAPETPAEAARGLAGRLEIVAAAARARAWCRSRGIARALVGALDDAEALPRILAGAVGCGPGATPAGDDVITGILAVLASPHSGARGAAAARPLRERLRPLLPATSGISAHLLRQACDGWFARSVHALAAALAAGPDPRRAREAARRVLEIGASSGADLCMGMLAAASEFLPRREPAAA